MKRIILLGISLLTYCSVFAQGVKFDTISLDQALARAQAEGKFVFVDVTASWCEPCQLMFEEVLSKKEVGEFCNKQFVCIQIDINWRGKILKKVWCEVPPDIFYSAKGWLRKASFAGIKKTGRFFGLGQPGCE